MPTLPDIKAKVQLDDSQLAKGATTAGKTGAAIEGAMKGGVTHTLRFEQSLTTLMSHFGGMPPIVNEAGRSLESMLSQGVTGMGLLGGGALLAVGAIGEVVGSSMKAYQDLGDQVENYRRVVGASAEESSRMVYAFNALGVSEETATQGMFKLSKALETAPKKLEALGITAVRDAAGNTDLSKTLFVVADAYNATSDQAKKNLILFDAFGKSGKDMIPILEQGSTALKNLESSASLLFSAADLERLKQAKIHTQEVKSAFEEWWAAAVGQPAENAKAAFVSDQLASAYAQKKYSDGLADGTIKANAYGPALGKLIGGFKDEWYATQKVQESLVAATQATADQTAANDALWASVDKVITEEEAQKNSEFALRLANLTVKESQDAITTAQKAYTAAVKQFGSHSIEARRAADDITRAHIAQQKAYLDAAAAARTLQEKQDIATTGSKDAAKETQVYVDKLQAEANSLSPKSPLRKYLQDYINQLKNDIPAAITTDLFIKSHGVNLYIGPGGNRHFAAGGRPPIGVPSVVGEKGPEIFVPDQPGTIVPHGQAASTGTAAAQLDVQGIEDRLDKLIAAVSAEPSTTGVAADLWKAVQGAGLNRLRGFSGA